MPRLEDVGPQGSRAGSVIDRILRLDESLIEPTLADIDERFAGRHRDLTGMFEANAEKVVTVIDPAIAYDAGFRLSALATAGLLAKSKEWSARAIALGPRIPRQLRGPWLTVAEEVAVALAAQSATLGLVIASFGRVAIWSDRKSTRLNSSHRT